MFGYVASSVIQNTNQCQTLSFLGEKLMFDEHERAQWGTILGPLHCTGNPKDFGLKAAQKSRILNSLKNFAYLLRHPSRPPKARD